MNKILRAIIIVLAVPTIGTAALSVNNSGGVTGVTATSAWLNASIASTGVANPALFILYGTNNGGSNLTSWATTNAMGVKTQGTYSAQATGLTPFQLYYYRVYATNGTETNWSGNSAMFYTLNQGTTASPVSAKNLAVSSNGVILNPTNFIDTNGIARVSDLAAYVPTTAAAYLASLTNGTLGESTSNAYWRIGRDLYFVVRTNYEAAGTWSGVSNTVVYTNDALYTDTVAKAASAVQDEVDPLSVHTNEDVVWTMPFVDTNVVVVTGTLDPTSAAGTYSYLGMLNGQPSFKMGTWYIYYDNGIVGWGIDTNYPNEHVYGWEPSGAGTFPFTSWEPVGVGIVTGTAYVAYTTVTRTNTYRFGVTNDQQFLSRNGTNLLTMDGNSNVFAKPVYIGPNAVITNDSWKSVSNDFAVSTQTLDIAVGNLKSATGTLDIAVGNLKSATNTINIVADAALSTNGGTMKPGVIVDMSAGYFTNVLTVVFTNGFSLTLNEKLNGTNGLKIWNPNTQSNYWWTTP